QSSESCSRPGRKRPASILSFRPANTPRRFRIGKRDNNRSTHCLRKSVMQLRTLGSSGLVVSPICLGTMTFGAPVSEAESIRLVHAAIDMGINFIDTANVYEGYRRLL